MKTSTAEESISQPEEDFLESPNYTHSVRSCLATDFKSLCNGRATTCLTIQEVSGAQVYVDAGMEARDEPVERPLLDTLTFQPAVEGLCCNKQTGVVHRQAE